MSIKRTASAGFTLVEVSVALLLSGMGMLALLGTQSYFEKIRLSVDARSTHTLRRNQVYQALSGQIRICPPGGSTVNCPFKNTCATSLLKKNGGAVVIPSSKLTSNAPITIADRVELQIALGTGANSAIPASAFIRSTTIPLPGMTTPPPTALELADHLRYEVLLTGTLRSTSTTNQRTYAGAVELIGHRDFVKRIDLTERNDQLRAQIPVEFTVDSTTGALTDCIARTTERTISGGLNTIDRCVEAGGTTVPSALGNLCRFRTPLALGSFQPECPFGFIESSPTVCTVDPTADSDTLDTIPPCPNVKDGNNVSFAGTKDPVDGSLYCTYQGIAAGSPLGPCPDDPDWDGISLPRDGWDDVSSPPFNVAVNSRRCKYDFVCDPPAVVVKLAPPIGDGATPSCSYAITQCPNTTPPTVPAPWPQIMPATPLKCRLNTIPPAAPLPAQCGAGFNPVDTTSHPEIVPWNNLPTASRSGHIVCF